MKQIAVVALVAMTTALVSSVCFALVETTRRGEWPDTWPEELEPLRQQATTRHVRHGIQETVYEVPFRNANEFEKAWPYFLSLKSAGAPLIIEKSPSAYPVSGSTANAGVRMLCPSEGMLTTTSPNGTQLSAGPPWPDHLTSESGTLPEYVINDNGKWAPADNADDMGFKFRARGDIVLIADGRIVNLNNIPLPPDTPIIDRRFEEKVRADARQ